MNARIDPAVWALTEKEKQTLRLIVRGHDAKSTARNLGLSVHTINERLRDARRKMEVSSSREAARLLLEVEGDGKTSPTPYFSGDTEIGEDPARARADRDGTPIDGARRRFPVVWMITGGLLMTLVLGLLAFAAMPQSPAAQPQAPAVAADAVNKEVVDAALRFLTLVDQGNWDESYRATGAEFRKLNTAQVWSDVSQKVRVPLGAVISRTFDSEQNLPAPPYGYEVVKFRTSYANKANAIETVSLDREDGVWRVVGVTIE
jgi:DNA-binding CsgD family transcriptional regulator